MLRIQKNFFNFPIGNKNFQIYPISSLTYTKMLHVLYHATLPHLWYTKNQIIGFPIILIYHKCVMYTTYGILPHICGIVYHKCGFPRNPYTRCPRKMFISFWDTLYCLHKKVFTRYVHKLDFQTIYLTLN